MVEKKTVFWITDEPDNVGTLLFPQLLEERFSFMSVTTFRTHDRKFEQLDKSKPTALAIIALNRAYGCLDVVAMINELRVFIGDTTPIIVTNINHGKVILPRQTHPSSVDVQYVLLEKEHAWTGLRTAIMKALDL
ncbi:MAG: hypothetical protein ABIH21_03125 [Patescibacteria group bacterium]